MGTDRNRCDKLGAVVIVRLLSKFAVSAGRLDVS